MAKLAIVDLAELSPARRRLADHLDEVARAAGEFAKARLPFDKILHAIKIAEQNVQTAQTAIDEASQQAAAEIARGATITVGQTRTAATSRLAAAEQAIRDAKAALALVEPDFRQAQQRHEAALARTDSFLVAIISEEADAAFTKLRGARAAMAAADAAVRALQIALPEHARKLRGADPTSWFALTERIAAAYNLLPRAEMTTNELQLRVGSWESLMVSLRNDPAAVA